MAISAEDVVILKSERQTDETDGGGQMTGTVIPNGQINNLWDDISRPLMAIGGVSMRKLFLAVRSANADKGLGSHFIILKDSSAANVSTLLFSTGDHYDQRLSAQNAVEQYVVMSTRSSLRPVGTQRQGQVAITVYSEDVDDAPEVGEVLILVQGNKQQAVKINRVGVRRVSYTYINNSSYAKFTAYEMTLTITQPLQYEFEGADPSPLATRLTDIYNAQTNAGARYYGIKPLAAAALSGSRSVQVESIFSPVIPAATTEQAVLDQKPGLLASAVQQSGVSRVLSLGTHSGTAMLTLPNGWVPGSLQLTIGGSLYTDDGSALKLASGIERLSAAAVVDARRGTLQLPLLSSQAISATFLPGVTVELMPYTDSVTVTAGNRQLTYTEQLAPVPMPGSVRIEFSYLGRWFTITDNGTGKLSGSAASGTINYTTGSLSFTLPGEPDLGTDILYTWAQSPYRTLPAAVDLDAWVAVDLPAQPVAGTAVITWSRNSSQYTATANASNVLAGHASGYIRGTRIYMRPTAMPTSAITVSFSRHIAGVQLATMSVAEQTGGSLSINLGTSVRQGSVSFSLQASVDVNTTINGVVTTTRVKRTYRMVCDGLNRVMHSRQQVGSIDTNTGVITLDASSLRTDVSEFVQTDSSALGGGQYLTTTKTVRIETQSLAVSYYASTTATPVVETHTQALADTLITADLDATQPFIPGSIVVALGGLELVDRGDGYLYRSFNAVTAAGLQTGQIDYPSGSISIPLLPLVSTVPNIEGQLLCAASGIGVAAAVSKLVFRTSASPLRPSGLQFMARRAADAALLRAESANDGTINGSFDAADTLTSLPQGSSLSSYSLPIVPVAMTAGSASGTVDYVNGVVRLTFSQPVILSTLTYNAVSYTTIPLDPDVLGLNPVKLPTNGYVPVFQSGYLAVVHNTQRITLAAPIAGQVLECGRPSLAVVTIKDAADTDLDPAMFVVDRVTGVVTLADPFTAQDAEGNSLTLPLTLSHRVEDVVSLGVVGVDGTLQLLTELTHDYPAETSFVSAAVYFGTLQARIKNMHDRQTDDGGFDDTTGTPATASFDSVNWPILIDNRSAVKERWKIKFTSSTGFQCIGEQRGVIGTGSINADFAPLNPFTGEPYFTIKTSGWGAGWVASNVLRFDTDPAAAPVWAIRTVLPSSGVAPEDATIFEGRVEAD